MVALLRHQCVNCRVASVASTPCALIMSCRMGCDTPECRSQRSVLGGVSSPDSRDWWGRSHAPWPSGLRPGRKGCVSPAMGMAKSVGAIVNGFGLPDGSDGWVRERNSDL